MQRKLFPLFFLLVLTTRSLAVTATATHASDAATPDCGLPALEPFPTQQRTRLLARLGVDAWHRAGCRGQGVKVAVLDSGFRGYRQHLGNALPARVTVRSFRGDGNLEAKDSQHGILCAEVVHALAPDAELLFANWEPNRSDQFLEAVRWARQEGARIITCSIIMPSWSDGEGGGDVHQDLARILGSGAEPADLLCFASAGNTAQRHWSGRFRDAGGGLHEWTPGHTDQVVTPWGTDAVSVEMCWQPGPDYELRVRDTSTGEEVGRTRCSAGQDRCCAVVRFQPNPRHTYGVEVRHTQGQPGAFHLVALGAGLRYATASGSIPFPGDGAAVVAVGAVNVDGDRVAYSSCGPNSSHPKPDLVATVPLPSLWRSRPFTGTSAAAPQAAGLAALICSRHPTWTAQQVRRAICSAARDLATPGHDFETGHGLIRLPGVEE